MKKKIFLPLLFILTSFVLANAAAAQQVEPLPIPMPPVWDLEGLSIEYQWVDVEIDDQVATTRVDQLFVNNSDRMLEGVYLFLEHCPFAIRWDRRENRIPRGNRKQH